MPETSDSKTEKPASLTNVERTLGPCQQTSNSNYRKENPCH